MQRTCQVAAICFVALSAFVIWESRGMEYFTHLGPGGGFFPLWMGIIMGGLSLAWAVQVFRPKSRPQDESLLPERAGMTRILLTVAALVALAGVMDLAGFRLTMFLFLVFLIRALGRQGAWITLASAFLGSFGIYHLFGRFLDVSLPAATLKFLARLGL